MNKINNVRLYKTKSIAKKNAQEQSKLLCNYNIFNYFILDSYKDFIQFILNSPEPRLFYECILTNVPVPLFFDVEIFLDKTPYEFNHEHIIINYIKDTVNELFPLFDKKVIILESHNNVKKSFHIIIRFSLDNQDFYFTDVSVLKDIVQTHFSKYTQLHNIIDLSVYREGLFRTIYSTKENQERPFIFSAKYSSPSDDINTFVGFKPSNEFQIIVYESSIQNIASTSSDIIPEQSELTDNDLKIIKQYIRSKYNYTNSHITDIFIDSTYNCIIVALSDKFCPNIDREHKSNHQYIVIDIYSSKRKCHDIECKDFKFLELKKEEYPPKLHKILKNVLKINRQELELIEQAIKECKEYIHNNYDDDTTDVVFDHNEMAFRGNVNNQSLINIIKGKCQHCRVEHHISDNGYCMKCGVCNTVFPKQQIIQVDEKYKNINSFWQYVNNGNINININNYYGEEEFNCDFKIDNIFRNKELTALYNQVLDGHKIIKISELISKIEIDFVYAISGDNGFWYYFDGTIWKIDKESLELKRRLLNLTNNFNKIKNYYENKQDNNYSEIIKNIKSLINKIYKPGFEDDIIKGAKIYYNDENFMKNLNSKKHLVPFHNGVYDLLTREFRKTKKTDYISLTLGFDYDVSVSNPEVYTFLYQVLPNPGVRDFVLKKMSECLNGDIPNTHFLFFIGESGANGKSQILNLMKLTMGDFGEKVEVTLITRKRNNAGDANTEKIKLMNKRFAFLSEPEDGEKINIGLLKELTGSEEIVARGLYQSTQSFIMEAKLFLACNELPEIKGEDQALWRRIRAIDFPSRFVDEPKAPNEFKIDRSLPSRMREDISWRQTFINILIEYYFRDSIKEPEEIKVRTNEYKNANNDFENWLNEHVEFTDDDEDLLQLEIICKLYLDNGTKINPKERSKYKSLVERWIKDTHPSLVDTYRQYRIENNIKRWGWKKLKVNFDSIDDF